MWLSKGEFNGVFPLPFLSTISNLKDDHYTN